MEIDITEFVNAACPMDYSASVAEIGTSAGSDTWRAACDDAEDHWMLDTEEKREAFREWVKPFGAWSDDEIAAWSDTELNALFIQWVAGDMRECGITANMSDDEWTEIEADQSEGRTPGNIGRSIEPGVILFCLYH